MLALYHSSQMVIGVMDEVRKREDAYESFKRIVADIEGIPSTLDLASRERHVLWQGPTTSSIVEEDDNYHPRELDHRNGTPKIVIGHASPREHTNAKHENSFRAQTFILSDLVLFAVPAAKSWRRESKAWVLWEEIGAAKLLGMRGVSSTSGMHAEYSI